MFFNGLALGCMWGVIFSFIEGRRVTDMLASLLGISMVIGSGAAKSLGLFVMDHWQVSEFWMPALIGGCALPCLALLGYVLQSLPKPSEEDRALKADQGMEDVDDFDFICYVAYGKKPLTRKERAKNVKKKDFFSKYSADAQAVLDILLDKYMNLSLIHI